MQITAQGWLVYHLTQSAAWLGIVACAAGLPSLVLSPFAGVVVDRYPRRNILLISQTVQMILAHFQGLKGAVRFRGHLLKNPFHLFPRGNQEFFNDPP